MTGPSTLEIALFAALLLASVFLFWRRFGRVAAIIRASRPDTGFAASPWAPRIARFIAEVLLQSKVIRHRPLPGLAHAFVFWGFLAFALVTLNHLAHGFGFAFFDTKTGFLALSTPFCLLSRYLSLFRSRTRPAALHRPPSLARRTTLLGIGLVRCLSSLMVTYVLEYQWGESRVLWWARWPCSYFCHYPPYQAPPPDPQPAHHPPETKGLPPPPLRDDDDFGLDGRDISQRPPCRPSPASNVRCQQHAPTIPASC